MATKKKKPIVLSVQELVELLHQDLDAVLKLRGDNHFRSGRPDEDGCETYEEYLAGCGEHEDKWVRWADATYDANNKMGGYLGHAFAVLDAIERWLHEDENREEAQKTQELS